MQAEVKAFFDGRPETYEQFRAVHDQFKVLGPFDISVASQISFGVNRKFAWFWLYNVTKKNPNGVLHLMLCMDRRTDDPHVRNIEQTSKNRWNHQIVVRSLDDATSDWLKKLLEAAYNFGAR